MINRTSQLLPAVMNTKHVGEVQSLSLPTKVFIERDLSNPIETLEYSLMAPGGPIILNNLLYGSYGRNNLCELFFCLPEVFAPINEIASRVADANWQLLKTWNDEIDWSNQWFNKYFSKPNPLQTMRQLVYNAVCYEILAGGQFFFFNKPSLLAGDTYENVLGIFNLNAPVVNGKQNLNVDPYLATDINDFVYYWEETINFNNRVRRFETKDVLPILHLGLNSPHDINARVPLLLGAQKAIENLLPVYQARRAIYIKRGAMGFIVSRKSDENGGIPLTPKERTQLEKDFTDSYGISGGKSTVAMTGLPVDFVKTSMSIEELQPFDETLSDAVAIYATLRVPPHLVPRKDHSTYANADADMKAFYTNVIIPWAKKYAMDWNDYLKFDRRYIEPNYDHIEVLQENYLETSKIDETYGRVWQQRFTAGVCTLNEWIVAIDGTKGTGPVFDKKISEMTPEELDMVKGFMNLKSVAPNPNDPNDPNNETDPEDKPKDKPKK